MDSQTLAPLLIGNAVALLVGATGVVWASATFKTTVQQSITRLEAGVAGVEHRLGEVAEELRKGQADHHTRLTVLEKLRELEGR